MNENKTMAICMMENVDDTLRGLYDTISMAASAANGYGDGEYFESVLMFICRSLQSARAELDEATTAVMRMQLQVIA